MSEPHQLDGQDAVDIMRRLDKLRKAAHASPTHSVDELVLLRAIDQIFIDFGFADGMDQDCG